jgi:hypothetical protein
VSRGRITVVTGIIPLLCNMPPISWALITILVYSFNSIQLLPNQSTLPRNNVTATTSPSRHASCLGNIAMTIITNIHFTLNNKPIHKRIEQRLREAEKRPEEERSRAEEEQRKTRHTTFEEYIGFCYKFISKPLHVQTDKSLSTQGSIASPKNKPRPTLLKPWTDFPIRQQQLFERVCKYIPRNAESFSSIQYLKELGQDLCDRPLASKKDLKAYQRLAVDRPSTNIISHLQGEVSECIKPRLWHNIRESCQYPLRHKRRGPAKPSKSSPFK